jgi:hypothetical protein
MEMRYNAYFEIVTWYPLTFWIRVLSQARGTPLGPKSPDLRGSPSPYIYSHRHPPIYAPGERFSTCDMSEFTRTSLSEEVYEIKRLRWLCSMEE